MNKFLTAAPIFLFPTAPEKTATFPKTDKTMNIYCTGPGNRIVSILHTLPQDKTIVLMGYAGGLAPSLKTGDIIISPTFLTSNFPPIEISIPPLLLQQFSDQGISPLLYPCYTTDKVVTSKKQKEQLYKYGAHIVDMENYWFAQKAKEMRISNFITIRVVLDEFDYALPDLSGTLSKEGHISALGTFYHICRYPHHVISMCQIFKKTKKVAPILQKCRNAILAYMAKDHI